MHSSGWKVAGSWLGMVGLTAFFAFDPLSAFGPVTQIVFAVLLLPFVVGVPVAMLRRQLRRGNPARAAQQAYHSRFNAMVDDVVALFDQGISDEGVAIRIHNETGHDYEQVLADVRQLRLDHEANTGRSQ